MDIVDKIDRQIDRLYQEIEQYKYKNIALGHKCQEIEDKYLESRNFNQLLEARIVELEEENKKMKQKINDVLDISQKSLGKLKWKN